MATAITSEYRLFRRYCSSNYGCELRLLDNSCVQDFCVAWRKGAFVVTLHYSTNTLWCHNSWHI